MENEKKTLPKGDINDKLFDTYPIITAFKDFEVNFQ